MSEVKRYDLCEFDGGLIARDSGFLVGAEDYDAIHKRLTVAEQRNAVLESALKFYADGDHLLLADSDAWDTCSGEPINFLHDEAGTASVEDGSIAKAALKPAEAAAPIDDQWEK